MEKKGKSLKQEGLRNQWGSPEVVKKDFLLIPIYIVFQNSSGLSDIIAPFTLNF